MKYGLTNEEWVLINDLLVEPLKSVGACVWIFGSRARGDYKRVSDIDVLYELPPDKNLPSGLMSKILEDLEESRLPYKVDITNRSAVAESYRKQVESEKIQI